MGNFKHEILGGLDTTSYWLKIIPQKMFIELVVVAGSLMMLLNIFPLNAFFISIYIAVILTELVLVLLRLMKKDSAKYMEGGGCAYFDCYRRKIYRKMHKVIYTLGIAVREDK